jgi:uncharacterized protein YdcH (DUF465 family)
MEGHEREKILKILHNNTQLKRLYERHQSLAGKVEELEKRKFKTPADQIAIRKLKLDKLRGKERMLQIVAQDAPA